MIEQLFGSKTRVKLLRLFYGNPNRSFYVREITRKIDEQINSVRRELANLLNVGIIISDNTNNRLYYEVNQTYEFYNPFLTIFGEAKQVGVVSKKNNKPASHTVEDDRLKALGHIEVMIYTGQFTRDEASGVDLLVVGDINGNAMQKYITELESKENKEIRYTVMPMTEFNYRRQINDRFLTTLMSSKKQVIIDRSGTV
jgi:hypothetical protein